MNFRLKTFQEFCSVTDKSLVSQLQTTHTFPIHTHWSFLPCKAFTRSNWGLSVLIRDTPTPLSSGLNWQYFLPPDSFSSLSHSHTVFTPPHNTSVFFYLFIFILNFKSQPFLNCGILNSIIYFIILFIISVVSLYSSYFKVY